jgi:group I intron endonuclease
MPCTIYVIRNRVNEKVYVGQTWKNLKHRFAQHTQSTWCRKLANAIKCHGKGNFYIKPLAYCGTQEAADLVERFFIKVFDCIQKGYNLREGGESGHLASEETRRRMSYAKKGKKPSNFEMLHSPESRQKQRLALKGNTNHKGKLASDETKAKMSASHKGLPGTRTGSKVTEETRRKISKKLAGESNPRAKVNASVVRSIREDRLRGVTLAEIARRYGLSVTQIGRIVRNESWR